MLQAPSSEAEWKDRGMENSCSMSGFGLGLPNPAPTVLYNPPSQPTVAHIWSHFSLVSCAIVISRAIKMEGGGSGTKYRGPKFRREPKLGLLSRVNFNWGLPIQERAGRKGVCRHAHPPCARSGQDSPLAHRSPRPAQQPSGPGEKSRAACFISTSQGRGGEGKAGGGQAAGPRRWRRQPDLTFHVVWACMPLPPHSCRQSWQCGGGTIFPGPTLAANGPGHKEEIVSPRLHDCLHDFLSISQSPMLPVLPFWVTCKGE